jgi:WD40 repeat protein
VSDAIGNPYKGLAAFDDSELDVLFFFGRDRERERITANLVGSRLTVLYGETGVGKSSILRAGVAHQLRGFDEPLAVVVFDNWRDQPAMGLARAAARAAGTEAGGSLADTLERCSATLDAELYLILDGVEEYFLYHPGDDGDRGFGLEFAQAVRRPGLRARFLLSLREDAVLKLDRFKRSIPNLFGNYLRLEHLDREAARSAIVGPLERHNELAGSDQRFEIEPELVEAVLDEVTAGRVELGRTVQGPRGDGTGTGRVATPYLQLVMHRLWDEESSLGSGVLRLSTFRALGGAQSIVRNHLEHALEALAPDQQDLAAEAFGHLVTPSGAKIAHSASDLARYASVDESVLLPVLQALVGERILRPTADEGGAARYEIYHDVLANAVAAWCLQHRSAREVERVRQAAVRKHRRLLAFALLALLLAGAMTAVTIFALTQRNEARAQARKSLARSLEASAMSQLQTDPELSLLLAVKAAQLEPDAAALDVLRRSLLDSRERAIFKADGPVTAVRQSPDGSRLLVAGGNRALVYELQLGGRKRPLFTLDQRAPIIAADYGHTGRLILTASADGRVLVWSALDGKLVRSLGAGEPLRSAEFDPSGSLIAAAGDHEVTVWRARTGSLVFRKPFSWSVTGAVFDPGGRLIAVIGDDRSILLYDLRGRLRRKLPQRDIVTNVAFSPNGKLLFAAGKNGSALLWDMRTRKRLSLRKRGNEVLASAFSHDGKRVATAGSNTDVLLFDAASGRLLKTLTGHTQPVVDVAFRVGDQYLATASRDSTVRVWRTNTGKVETLLAGHSDTVNEVMYTHGRGLVLTGSADGTARLWDPQNRPQLGPLTTESGPLLQATYIGAGGRILTAGPGREALLLQATDGHRVGRFRVPARVTAVAASRDGKLVAVGADSTVAVFDATSGKTVSRLPKQPSLVDALDFSPNGTTLVIGERNGAAQVWDLHGKRPLQTLTGHRGAITAVAFSQNGSWIATASDDSTARIWDAHSGRSLFTLNRDTDALTSVSWSPNGRLLLTASKDGDARLWDAQTGRPQQLLRGHLGPISDATFSPNGQWIVTTGPSLLQLWQPSIPEPLFPHGIIGTPGMTTTTFDPSSRRLLTANRHGTLLTSNCEICSNLQKIMTLAQQRLARTGRTLTAAEHQRYGV